MYNIILADIIRLLHLIIVFVSIVTPFSKNRKILLFNIILIISIVFQWNIIGYCILTKIEDYLRCNKSNTPFISRIINRYITISDKITNNIINKLPYLLLLKSIYSYYILSR